LDVREGKGREAGEDCIMRSFVIVQFTKYYKGDRIKEDEMGGACSTDGRDEKYLKCSGWKN
jgi:hypothetical protein